MTVRLRSSRGRRRSRCACGPTSLDEVAGQEHLLAPGSPLVDARADRDAARPRAASVILWGPPGTGKTTLAQAIARSSGRRFVELSAVTAGVRTCAQVMEEALLDARPLRQSRRCCSSTRSTASPRPSRTRCCPASRTAGSMLIAATTENPSFSVISPAAVALAAADPRAAERRRPAACSSIAPVDRSARPRRRRRAATTTRGRRSCGWRRATHAVR